MHAKVAFGAYLWCTEFAPWLLRMRCSSATTFLVIKLYHLYLHAFTPRRTDQQSRRPKRQTAKENVHSTWLFEEPGLDFNGLRFKGPEQLFQLHHGCISLSFQKPEATLDTQRMHGAVSKILGFGFRRLTNCERVSETLTQIQTPKSDLSLWLVRTHSRFVVVQTLPGHFQSCELGV